MSSSPRVSRRTRRVAAAVSGPAVEGEPRKGGEVAGVRIDAGHRDRTGAVEDRRVGDDLPLDVADAGVLDRLGKRPDAGERQIPRRGEAGHRERRIPSPTRTRLPLSVRSRPPVRFPRSKTRVSQPSRAAEAIEIGGGGEELRVGREDARVRARVRVEEPLRVRVDVIDVGAARAAHRVDLALQDVPQMVAGDALFAPQGGCRRERREFGFLPLEASCETPAQEPTASSASAARIPARAPQIAHMAKIASARMRT